jgi:hypothetical protein
MNVEHQMQRYEMTAAQGAVISFSGRNIFLVALSGSCKYKGR